MSESDDRPSRRWFLRRGLGQMSAAAALLATGRFRGHDWLSQRWRVPEATINPGERGQFHLRVSPGREYWINETGMQIWIRCDGSHRGADLVAALSALSGISPKRATEDVRAFLGAMAREGLVKLT